MRKIICIIFLFIVIPTLFVFAQEEDWYIGKEIVDIRFSGLDNISPSELEGITSQFIGQTFSDTLYWDLQSKLFALNYFEEFVPKAVPGDADRNSVIIEFQVTERPVVGDIKISGNSNIRTMDILDVVITKTDDIVNKAKIRLDAEAIENLYIEEGYPDVQVEGYFEKDEGKNTATVYFDIVEGFQTRVKTIRFSGNSFASETTLKRKMSTKEQSIFSSGIFQESKLQEDIQTILQYYRDNGYIDAEIVDVQREMVQEDGKNLLVLTLYIDEGEQYTYGGMSFEGNTLFSDEELMSKITQEPGDILNQTKLEIDYTKITDLYYNDGYIFNVIERKESRDEETNTVSYTIEIVERGRAHIENIILKGNTKTKDHVILRELPIRVGEVFSKDKVMTGIHNLMNLQYFNQVLPEMPYGSAPGLMDLVINVEEGRTTDIGFGVSFTGGQDGFPVVGFLNWTDSNFRGLGQELQIGTEISSDKQNLNFGFTENWLFDRRWSGSVNFEIARNKSSSVTQDVLFPIFTGTEPNAVPDPFDGHWVDEETGTPVENPAQDDIDSGAVVTDYEYAVSNGYSIPDDYKMEYNSFDFTLSGSTGFNNYSYLGRLGTGTGISTSLSYLRYDPSINRPFDEDIRASLDQWQFINRWWANVSWDTRDLINNPSKGVFLKESVSYTGGILGGKRDYIKSTTTGEVFFKLFETAIGDSWTLKPIIALHSSLAMIIPQYYHDGNTWTSGVRATTDDLLYTDWMLTAKGWPSMYDGEAMWDNWIELRIPLAEDYFSLTTFFSGTGFWTDLGGLASMTIKDFYFSLGSGIQLTIPNFPMGFYMVKRFKYNEDNQLVWQAGDLFSGDDPESGLDFVISFTLSYF